MGILIQLIFYKFFKIVCFYNSYFKQSLIKYKMLFLVPLVTLATLTVAQNTQFIDGTATVVNLYASTAAPVPTVFVTVTETTGTVTHICTHTIDVIVPMTATIIRQQYVTETFLKTRTETDTFNETYSTQIDPRLVIITTIIEGTGHVCTATDVTTAHQLDVETDTVTKTLTHTSHEVEFKTTTAWIEQTLTAK